MPERGRRLLILCERDVGLFSLIQQVVANIPRAIAEDRIPVVLFGDRCSYFTPPGHQGGKGPQTFSGAVNAWIKLGNTFQAYQRVHYRKSSKWPLNRRKKTSDAQNTSKLNNGTNRSLADSS